MKNERILISGAGIAGQTVAYWLARHGFRPTIVERAAQLSRGGQGVDIRGQAIAVAERIDIMARARASAMRTAGLHYVDAAGREIARVDMRRIQEKYDTADVEIMRGDLVHILHDVTSGQVEYLFGDSITALDQDTDGVTVTFDRSPARRFDLVIGADGLHSTVRRLAFGPEREFVHHMRHYFAFSDADPRLGDNGWMTMFNTPGQMAGIYNSATSPEAKAYFIFRSPELDIDHRDPESVRAVPTKQYAPETAWHVPQLLAAALADPDLYFDALAQVHLPTWSTDRIALVGDAAYCASPASGAGAELSLLGAYHLAGALAAANGNHNTAYPHYEQALRPLVTTKQKIGPNLRLMVPKSRLGITLRNTMTRLPLLVPLAGMERIMSPKSTPPLPHYPHPTPTRCP
ncbi:FAD-dependent monooxygenase [Nocardia crassostreae]|uniref:FAD-dependent monooxygenase n=1 Tax=Nocardia crassostreae TaxID=53428 RepID=UPI000831D517|nr:FAD-dependent monooxygenase [Nocardia crassostreae]